jgi:hypothetical protein
LDKKNLAIFNIFRVILVLMKVEADGDVVVKTAENASERRRLDHEADVLRAVAHPGIVRLRRTEGGDPPDRLVLDRVEGTVLTDGGQHSARQVASWGAAVATILADLHARGWAHGSVGPDHILLDRRGRPVLCGFGSAMQSSEPGAGRAAAADVSALARLVSDHLAPGEARLRRALARWDAGTRSGRRRGRDARALAALLARRVPDAAARPNAEEDAPEPDRRSGGVIPLVSMLAFAAGILVGSFLVGHPSGPGPTSGVPGYLLDSAPGEDPVVVVGRWGCGAARPAVLDLASGTIWAYPAWPGAGSRMSGVVLTKVAGATGLAAATGVRGCDRLLALRGSAGTPVVVEDPVPTGKGR